jgi:RNA recognition motif-containing protein
MSREPLDSCTVAAGLRFFVDAMSVPASNLQSIPRTSRQGLYLSPSLLFCELFRMKLYVGNLPFNATEDQVRTHFAAHGTVDKVSLVNDRETGRPRGFGFVEMPSADATRAMQALDGKDFGGRPLKVNEAQERDRGAPRGNFGGGGGGRRY